MNMSGLSIVPCQSATEQPVGHVFLRKVKGLCVLHALQVKGLYFNLRLFLNVASAMLAFSELPCQSRV